VPFRIHLRNQSFFFRPRPTFNLFLAPDRITHVAELFEINETGAVVIAGEAFVVASLVFFYPHFEFAGDAGVERATGVTLHHVNEIVAVGVHSTISRYAYGYLREKENTDPLRASS